MREFLMQAQDYKDQFVGSHLISQKMNGMRCFWDGGITRGMLNAPWLNGKGRSTGLWSRYGHVIHAPYWWVDMLPKQPLDGELDAGSWNATMSTCRKLVPVDSEWQKVIFKIFDSPNLDTVFMEGKINNPNYKIVLSPKMLTGLERGFEYPSDMDFKTRYRKLLDLVRGPNLEVITQHVIPNSGASDFVESFVNSIVSSGGEGAVIRSPHNLWYPKRVSDCLKVKPFLDAEGIVIGYEKGKGKYAGMLGSVIVQGNVVFNLSGMTDVERQVVWSGDQMLSHVFPIGSTITYKYRELSPTGAPIEARYRRPLC